MDYPKYLQEHVNGMKFREQEHRRKSDEERVKAELIQDERMKLEYSFYQENQESEKRKANFESLMKT